MLDDMSIVQPVMDWIVARSAWETYTNHLKVLSNDQLHVFLKLPEIYISYIWIDICYVSSFQSQSQVYLALDAWLQMMMHLEIKI